MLKKLSQQSAKYPCGGASARNLRLGHQFHEQVAEACLRHNVPQSETRR